MFSKARVGDPVWGVQGGDGVIEGVGNESQIYPIDVRFSGYSESYTVSGKYQNEDDHPSLFWKKPYSDVPEAPKRMVTKTFEGWVNINRTSMFVYPNKEAAETSYNPNRIVSCVKVTGTYEVEED